MIKKISLIAVVWASSFILHAATSYSCNGCSPSQYESVAKGSLGDVYVYDLVNSKLKRYNIVLITPAADSPTGEDIIGVYEKQAAQEDVNFINKVAEVRKTATINGTDIIYHADVDLAGTSFEEYSVYDIAKASYVRNDIAEFILFNGVTNSTAKKAVQVVADVGGNIIKIVLKEKVTVIFNVKTGDDGHATFIMSTNDIDGLPDFDIDNSRDADNNSIISSNSAAENADYRFTTETNLNEFLNYVSSLGITVTNGGPGIYGCAMEGNTLTCLLYD